MPINKLVIYYLKILFVLDISHNTLINIDNKIEIIIATIKPYSILKLLFRK